LPSAERALCDTGPLVAFIDSNDQAHEECRTTLKRFAGRLVTTWPVLSEAFYLLARQLERELLWQFILGEGLEIVDLEFAELPRMRSLMARYADLPMDFADASLIVIAERLRLNRVLTIDQRDFRVYRPRHIRSFAIFP